MRLFYFLIFITSVCWAKIDSLENELNNNQLTVEQRCEILHDVSLHYIDVDPEKAWEYTKQHNELASENSLEFQVADSKNIQGMLYRNAGDFENAISSFLQALKVYERLNKRKNIAMTYNNIGVAHMYNEIYSEAEKSYNKALELALEIKDTNVLKMIVNNLGIMACYDGDLEKGVEYFKKSLIIEKGLNSTKGVAECENNIGAAYYWMELTDSAMYYFESALSKEEQLGDVAGIAGSLVNLGELYTSAGDYEKAEKYLLKVLEITTENNISAEYQDGLFNLGTLYEVKGDFKQALVYQRKFQTVRDSVHSVIKAEQIADMQTKYETEKKEKKIAEQKIELAEKEARVQKRNLQLLGLTSGIIAITLIATIFYTRQKAKADKLEQQVALEQAESLNKVQNEKLRISRDLHDNIGSQLTFVISSLDNMNYIKDEEKKKEKLAQLSGFTRDTMNQLRETIWAIKSESITVEQLVSKVGDFIDKAKVACPNINFSIIGNGNSFQLNSNQAINTYRVIQEAVNNAIKYSHAQNIVFIVEPNLLQISDDGKGFNTETVKASNGLVNMKARMKEVGFSTEITSKEEEGTKISISLS